MRAGLVADLTTGRAAAALAEVRPSDLADPLGLVERLRKAFDPETAAAIAETARLRVRARAKFPTASSRMLFTDAGLQQASGEVVSDHRAERFGDAGLVIELGTGIGGDAMSLARRSDVVGVDLDADLLAIARHNVADPGFHPLRADITTLPPVPGAWIFADPARRTHAGRRIFDPEAYAPPLSVVVDRWMAPAAGGAVKVAPGLPDDRIPAAAEAEFVSLDGDMRECTLWFGQARSTDQRVATLLPGGHRLARTGAEKPLQIRPIGRWIHEPDPAVIRASLVGDLAAGTGLGGIDPTIAFLTGDDEVTSPFVRSFRVESWMPFNLKRLRAHLRTLSAGRLVVKKRGSAIDPDDLRRRLRVDGDEERTVIVTRAAGRPVAIVATVPQL